MCDDDDDNKTLMGAKGKKCKLNKHFGEQRYARLHAILWYEFRK